MRELIRIALRISRTKTAFIVAAAVILYAGLTPFDYRPENGASRHQEQGLIFRGSGKALITPADGSRIIPEGLDLIAIRLYLLPGKGSASGIGRICSFISLDGTETLFLGQWKNHLILRYQISGSVRYREAGYKDILRPDKPVMIHMISMGDRTEVFGNGMLLGTLPGLDLVRLFLDQDVDRVILGNSPALDSPWEGTIYKVLFSVPLHTRSGGLKAEPWSAGKDPVLDLSAPFELNLAVPPRLSPLQLNFLQFPERSAWRKWPNLVDAAVNLAGFIPFGFILGARLVSGCGKRASVIIMATLLGTLMSLFIETNQAFLIMRHSSLMDVIVNTAGTGMGAMCLYIMVNMVEKDAIA